MKLNADEYKTHLSIITEFVRNAEMSELIFIQQCILDELHARHEHTKYLELQIYELKKQRCIMADMCNDRRH